MTILGITAPLSWNSAAAIIKNGKLIAVAEEERYNRVKHAPRMPAYKSVEFCLQKAQVKFSEVDAIAFGYRSPFIAYLFSISENLKEHNFRRLVREAGAFAEYYIGLVRLKEWLELKGLNFSKTKVYFVPHHIAHATSAYRCSGFSESNIISLDGVGEDDAGYLGIGRNGDMKRLKRVGHHQSIGWVYADITGILGFRMHSHEGKVMGLSAYGKKSLPFDNFWQLKRDSYYLKHNWNKIMWDTFGPRRDPKSPITQRHKDIARTVQYFTENVGVRLAKKLYKETGSRNITLAGGVALNCNMNGKIWQEDFIDKIFVQPASTDAGTAIGAAMELAHTFGEPADVAMDHAYWGQEYTNEEIESVLREAKISYEKISNIEEVAAQHLSKGKIVGWFQGRSELGPRALGNRSILAHPGLSGMKDKVNSEVKHREYWRPFAPSILHEAGADYFEKYLLSPFMTITLKAKKKAIREMQEAIHIDHSARIQSVTKETNPRYHKLISAFGKRTGIPALMNTSFNDNEEPLVNSPKEALKVFMSTGMDILAIGDYLITKK